MSSHALKRKPHGPTDIAIKEKYSSCLCDDKVRLKSYPKISTCLFFFIVHPFVQSGFFN